MPCSWCLCRILTWGNLFSHFGRQYFSFAVGIFHKWYSIYIYLKILVYHSCTERDVNQLFFFGRDAVHRFGPTNIWISGIMWEDGGRAVLICLWWWLCDGARYQHPDLSGHRRVGRRTTLLWTSVFYNLNLSDFQNASLFTSAKFTDSGNKMKLLHKIYCRAPQN